MQLYQKDIVLQGGEAYQLRLTARSNGGQNVRLFLHKHDKPYTNYGLNGVELDLTSEWQVFVVEFTATGSVPLTDGRLRLWLAPFDEKRAVFEFDDVVLLPQSVVSAAAGTISALKTTALADQSATRQMTPTDWVPAHSVLVQGFFLDGDEQGRLEGGSVDKQKGASFCTNARPSRANLFPADGKMANINIVGLGRVKDLTITGITQDEEVIGPLPDAIINGRSVLLRKARDKDGEGRVYHVTFTATYHDNQTCSYDVVVGVPPDGKETAVDNVNQFDATIASP